jgi:hypothetical protein
MREKHDIDATRDVTTVNSINQVEDNVIDNRSAQAIYSMKKCKSDLIPSARVRRKCA